MEELEDLKLTCRSQLQENDSRLFHQLQRPHGILTRSSEPWLITDTGTLLGGSELWRGVRVRVTGSLRRDSVVQPERRDGNGEQTPCLYGQQADRRILTEEYCFDHPFPMTSLHAASVHRLMSRGRTAAEKKVAIPQWKRGLWARGEAKERSTRKLWDVSVRLCVCWIARTQCS